LSSGIILDLDHSSLFLSSIFSMKTHQWPLSL
jgi:hypothetical protein